MGSDLDRQPVFCDRPNSQLGRRLATDLGVLSRYNLGGNMDFSTIAKTLFVLNIVANTNCWSAGPNQQFPTAPHPVIPPLYLVEGEVTNEVSELIRLYDTMIARSKDDTTGYATTRDLMLIITTRTLVRAKRISVRDALRVATREEDVVSEKELSERLALLDIHLGQLDAAGRRAGRRSREWITANPAKGFRNNQQRLIRPNLRSSHSLKVL